MTGVQTCALPILTVLEDLSPGSVIEVLASAPAGLKGEAVVDVGFMEIL